MAHTVQSCSRRADSNTLRSQNHRLKKSSLPNASVLATTAYLR